jgi:hypothetical protein
MGAEMSLDYEVTKFFQDRQQRFEAAVAFATSMRYEFGAPLSGMSIKFAVQRADELIKELDETEE